VKTASGATAVQIVWSSRRGSRSIEHLGSAHDDQELEALKAAARQRLAAGQGEPDLGLPAGTSPSGPLEITSIRMSHLLDALETVARSITKPAAQAQALAAVAGCWPRPASTDWPRRWPGVHHGPRTGRRRRWRRWPGRWPRSASTSRPRR
jgi:hypothetical protein